ncbi:Ion transport protein/Polycystin cation channel [Novymonas esmeraldas]|uniref:Ion transport protein/Polycystin cation channel n=1 Tax=Novymonas esmeraldas TaxID=1808958 RepID=A0AAW0F5B1_9TRYP
MILFHSVVNIAILAILLLFVLQYQTVRNKEAADGRYTLASYLFASNDHTHSYLLRRIETIDEFVGTLEHTVRAYYAIPTRSRGLFMHYTDPGSGSPDAIAPPELFLQYHLGHYGTPAYARLAAETYPLSLDFPTGPFANATALLNNSRESCTPQVDPVAGGAFIPCRVSPIGDLLDRVGQLRLSFSLFSRSRQWAGGRAATVPSTWDVVVDYGFEGHKAVVTMAVRLSSVSRRQLEPWPLLLCWAVGLLALVDAYARLGEQVTASADAAESRRGYVRLVGDGADEAPRAVRRESSASATAQASENGWRWLGYLSNVAAVSFAAVALVAQHRSRTSELLEEAVTLLLALAAMLSSFRVVVLLKLFPAWYVLIDGLATALQQLSVLVVGVVPVLLGYAVCGTAVFGGMSGTYFQSIPNSVVTLLCSMFGDNLLDTFLRMDESPHTLQVLFARLFIITFLALFVCNILNIAHSIIQDSYSQALKTYAGTVAAAAAEADAAEQQQQQQQLEQESNDADRDGGAERRSSRGPGEPVSDSTASAADTSVSPSRHNASAVGGEHTRQSTVRPHVPRGGLRAADVEQMLGRLERVPF